VADLRPAAEVEWTVETAGIRLWRGDTPPVFLAYPEAAAWDLVARGVSRPRMVRLLAAIWTTDEADAEGRLLTMLDLWRHRGWLEGEATGG
jgi:hypothetical protein